MGVVKFDRHDEVNELLARLYLDCKIKLTKKELLELLFDFGSQDYELFREYLLSKTNGDTIELRKKFIKNFAGKINIDSSQKDIDPKSIWKVTIDE